MIASQTHPPVYLLLAVIESYFTQEPRWTRVNISLIAEQSSTIGQVSPNGSSSAARRKKSDGTSFSLRTNPPKLVTKHKTIFVNFERYVASASAYQADRAT